MRRREFFWIVVCLALSIRALDSAVITFEEPIQRGAGFNGALNEFILSADGEFRLEASLLSRNSEGLISIDTLPPDSNVFGMRNGTIRARTPYWIITRTDGQEFDLVSLDLIPHPGFDPTFEPDGPNPSQIAMTEDIFAEDLLANLPWALFTGDLDRTVTVDVGPRFTNLTQIYLQRPTIGGLVGGVSHINAIDNIVLSVSSGSGDSAVIPEPASISLLGLGAAALGFVRRRKRLKATAR